MTTTPNRSITPRGFATYDEFADSYGATVRVRESSAASGPHVWVFVEGGGVERREVGKLNDGSGHFNYSEAKRLRDALDTFLSEAPERWGMTEEQILANERGEEDDEG